jgi:tetratricopeptide (TPR) repeat protein
LDRALVHGRQALDIRPGQSGLTFEWARVSVWRLSLGNRRGDPPWETFELALGVVLRGLARDSEARSLREALGYLWGERAEFERTHGLDPRPSLEQSMQEFELALKKGPSFSAHVGAGNAALMRGQWEVAHGAAGALGALERADQAYRDAGRLAPFHSVISYNLAEVALWKAKAAGLGTAKGMEALAKGEARFEEDVKRFPGIAILWLRGAQLAEAQGHKQSAKARIQRAFALDSQNAEIRSLIRAIQSEE